MEWIQPAVAWLERNAVEIAFIEFLILVPGMGVKMVFEYLRRRRHRRQTAEQQAEIARLAAANEQVLDIYGVVAQLDMKSLGDVGSVGRLLDGTNLVMTTNGKVFIRLPINIKAHSGRMKNAMNSA